MVYNPATSPWQCECSDGWVSAGSTCVSKEGLEKLEDDRYMESSDFVTYYDVIDAEGEVEDPPVTVEGSAVYRELYIASAIGCRDDGNPQACQTLANLCVLQLYNERTAACRLFKDLTGKKVKDIDEDTGEGDADTDADTATTATDEEKNNNAVWKEGLPWLYYSQRGEETKDVSEVLAETLDLTVAFEAEEDERRAHIQAAGEIPKEERRPCRMRRCRACRDQFYEGCPLVLGPDANEDSVGLWG